MKNLYEFKPGASGNPGRTATFNAFCLLLGLLLAGPVRSQAVVTNNVTGGDSINYTINGQSDPTLTLQRGSLYVFKLGNLTIHPFWIKSALGTGSTGHFDTGVTNNGATSGDIYFAVPTNAPSQLFYQCGNHASMTGPLNLIDPPTPPAFGIADLVVSNRVVLRHAGTNTFTYTPEYKTNFVTTNWLAVVVQSNRFANGTNEIFCGLPAGSNVFFRIRAQ